MSNTFQSRHFNKKRKKKKPTDRQKNPFYYKISIRADKTHYLGLSEFVQEKASNRDKQDPSYGLKPPTLANGIQ